MYIQKKPHTTDKGGKLISDRLFSYLLLLALFNSAYVRACLDPLSFFDPLYVIGLSLTCGSQ
jgi:hypothetical protein